MPVYFTSWQIINHQILYVAHDTFFLGIRHIFFQVDSLYEFECSLKKLNEQIYN